MSNDAEYHSLVNQKTNAQAQYKACETRIKNYDYLLSRLKPSKNALSELKESFKGCNKIDKDLYKDKFEWKGSTYNDFSLRMENLIDVNKEYLKHSLDRILDSINDEITRIENKKMEDYGLLGRLGSWINSLANKIENFFN